MPFDASLIAHTPWKTTNEHLKHYSGRKPFRNTRATGNPPRRTVPPDHQYRFDPDDPTFCDSDPEEVAPSDDDEQDEETLFHWEEESTLFSDLLDASPSEPEDHEYDELINLLQPAFNDCGRVLKREVADMIVPTVKRVKDLYGQIDSKVDDNFGKGIITFNNACKELEMLAMRDEDELKDARTQFQRKTKELLAQLKEAYATRDRLWADYEKAIRETGDISSERIQWEIELTCMNFQTTVEPTLQSLRDSPADIEHIIGNLQKQARTLEKEDSNALSAAKSKIKGLLAKV